MGDRARRHAVAAAEPAGHDRGRRASRRVRCSAPDRSPRRSRTRCPASSRTSGSSRCAARSARCSASSAWSRPARLDALAAGRHRRRAGRGGPRPLRSRRASRAGTRSSRAPAPCAPRGASAGCAPRCRRIGTDVVAARRRDAARRPEPVDAHRPPARSRRSNAPATRSSRCTRTRCSSGSCSIPHVLAAHRARRSRCASSRWRGKDGVPEDRDPARAPGGARAGAAAHRAGAGAARRTSRRRTGSPSAEDRASVVREALRLRVRWVQELEAALRVGARAAPRRARRARPRRAGAVPRPRVARARRPRPRGPGARPARRVRPVPRPAARPVPALRPRAPDRGASTGTRTRGPAPAVAASAGRCSCGEPADAPDGAVLVGLDARQPHRAGAAAAPRARRRDRQRARAPGDPRPRGRRADGRRPRHARRRCLEAGDVVEVDGATGAVTVVEPGRSRRRGVVMIRKLGWLLGAVMLGFTGIYTIVYVYRWEWNRALFVGMLFVAVEVAAALALVLRRSPSSSSGSRRRPDRTTPVLAHLRVDRAGAEPLRLAGAVDDGDERLHHRAARRRRAAVRRHLDRGPHRDPHRDADARARPGAPARRRRRSRAGRSCPRTPSSWPRPVRTPTTRTCGSCSARRRRADDGADRRRRRC